MGREKTGWVGQDETGRWFYRYQYTDASQKRRNIRRLAKSEANAKSELRKALNRMEQQGIQSVEGDRLRFSQLIDLYKQRKVFEATYVGETKVAGLRSLRHVEMLIKNLTNHFQNRLLKMITHSEIEQFKLKRLNTPKDNEEQRSIASVNRELELLRAVMNFAKREGFILKSPFEQGAPLISKADETRRNRVLSYREEQRLLAACDITTYQFVRYGRTYQVPDTEENYRRRQLLKAIVIMAVDTAMRRGEIFKLEWRDVDLEKDEIIVRAFNSKTAQERSIGITPRLKLELQKLWRPTKSKFDKVFDYDKPDSTIKRVWATACRNANLDNLRFHDLRHTAVTRMIATGEASATIMKVSGHSQMSTFQRYNNPTTETIKSLAHRLHDLNHHSSNVQMESRS